MLAMGGDGEEGNDVNSCVKLREHMKMSAEREQMCKEN